MRMGILKACVDYQISRVRPIPSSREGLKRQRSLASTPRQKAGRDTEGRSLEAEAVFHYAHFQRQQR